MVDVVRRECAERPCTLFVIGAYSIGEVQAAAQRCLEICRVCVPVLQLASIAVPTQAFADAGTAMLASYCCGDNRSVWCRRPKCSFDGITNGSLKPVPHAFDFSSE